MGTRIFLKCEKVQFFKMVFSLNKQTKYSKACKHATCWYVHIDFKRINNFCKN